jgi:hypothetical protein
MGRTKPRIPNPAEAAPAAAPSPAPRRRGTVKGGKEKTGADAVTVSDAAPTAERKPRGSKTISKGEQFGIDMLGVQFGSKMEGYRLADVVAEMRQKHGAAEVDAALKSLGVDVSGIPAAPSTNVVSQAGDATGAVVPVTSSDGSLPPVPADMAAATAAAAPSGRRRAVDERTLSAMKPVTAEQIESMNAVTAAPAASSGPRKRSSRKNTGTTTVTADSAAGTTPTIAVGAGTVVPNADPAAPAQPAAPRPAMDLEKLKAGATPPVSSRPTMDMSALANPLTPDQQAALAGMAQQSSQPGGSQPPAVQGSPSFWKRIGMNPPASTGLVGVAGAKSLYQNFPTIANLIGGGVGTGLALKYGGPPLVKLFQGGKEVDETDEVLNQARQMYMQQGNFGN